MLSTVQLLKHTIEQNRYHLDNENRLDIEGVEDSIQQTQPTQITSSDQKINKSEITAVDSANLAQPSSVTFKEPQIERQNSSWLTKQANKVLGLLTPKSQVSKSMTLKESSHTALKKL